MHTIALAAICDPLPGRIPALDMWLAPAQTPKRRTVDPMRLCL